LFAPGAEANADKANADKANAGKANAFVPEQPVMAAGALRAGMKGYLLTVLKGTKPVRMPLEIVSLLPKDGGTKQSVVIRLLPSPEGRTAVAQGMSGSPVFVGGKLVGAVGMGWDFSDHRMALVTPIEDMCGVFSHPDRPATGGAGANAQKTLGAPLVAGGLSSSSAASLARALDAPVEALPRGTAGDLPLNGERFVPGEAVAVLLAWGDVEMSATGTVTATSKDGRFLAFGHSFMDRGAVNFPVARAYIHGIVESEIFPFKLASPVSLAGTATQDRSAGVGARVGRFTPSIAAALAFKNADETEKLVVKNFRVVPDAFLGSRLLKGIYGGLVDDLWDRKGQGTATVTLRVEGAGLEQGWTRTNVFFSDTGVGGAALEESALIMEIFLQQPFKEITPIGFRLDVSVTQEPRILLIEDVNVPEEAKAGDTLDVEVTLRPWRSEPVKKRFKVAVPKDASGLCELIVRGGGTLPLPQLALEGGWRAIDGFERLLSEMNASDANNELIVEFNCDRPNAGEDGKKNGKDGGKPDGGEKSAPKKSGNKAEKPQKSARARNPSAGVLPEEKEFLSETKARRIKEGTLRVSRSDYVVEGLMRRLIDVGESGK
jgi:hypothetical protein